MFLILPITPFIQQFDFCSILFFHTQVLRGTQQIKEETPHTAIPTTTPTPTQQITAQQLKETKETKKAKADAWKRLIPIAYEISELRQSGEKPFETEEVTKSLRLNQSYFSSISVSSLLICNFYLVNLSEHFILTILSLLPYLHSSYSFFTPATVLPLLLLIFHYHYSFTPPSSLILLLPLLPFRSSSCYALC
jgi:hypothetical protein